MRYVGHINRLLIKKWSHLIKKGLHFADLNQRSYFSASYLLHNKSEKGIAKFVSDSNWKIILYTCSFCGMLSCSLCRIIIALEISSLPWAPTPPQAKTPFRLVYGKIQLRQLSSSSTRFILLKKLQVQRVVPFSLANAIIHVLNASGFILGKKVLMCCHRWQD